MGKLRKPNKEPKLGTQLGSIWNSKKLYIYIIYSPQKLKSGQDNANNDTTTTKQGLRVNNSSSKKERKKNLYQNLQVLQTMHMIQSLNKLLDIPGFECRCNFE